MVQIPDYQDFTFQSHATSAADGSAFGNDHYSVLTVDIEASSDNASRTIEFKGKAAGASNYKSIMGINLASLTSAVNTTNVSEQWQFDIAGIGNILMDISAMSGGSITIRGRAVS